MSTHSETVHVERRFALSARLDSDLQGSPPLKGYVVQASVGTALGSMLEGIARKDRFAFTWTGPYGGGKSSAALLIANMVGGNKSQKALARSIAGENLCKAADLAFGKTAAGWRVVALTGRRAGLVEALAEALGIAVDDQSADYRSVLDALDRSGREAKGLLLIVDELGKFLEHALDNGLDVHFLQDLAERVARSEGRLVFVGILHQSFEQYAARIGKNARDEWAKVQGRFQNVPFIAQADEVAALLSRAIVCDAPVASAFPVAEATAAAIGKRRPVDADHLARTLHGAWPLHPVTTLLLGPVSRQRFAQNERSVFGFLTSAEPYGFQSFLLESGGQETYNPDRLWDYLVANFGSALETGPQGDRMTLAFDAVQRAQLRGPLHAKITKTAAVIELFRNGSGLAVSEDFLSLVLGEAGAAELPSILDDLVDQSILIAQPRLGGYGLFAGSDFDVDEAISRLVDDLDTKELLTIPSRLGLGPAIAKRHYFETGALRSFELITVFVQELQGTPADWAARVVADLSRLKPKGTGVLCAIVAEENRLGHAFDVVCGTLSTALNEAGILAAVSAAADAALVQRRAGDFVAVQKVEETHPQLQGDRIARRQLASRRVQIAEELRRQTLSSFERASWWTNGAESRDLEAQPLSVVASRLSDLEFERTPVLRSELLYRDRPSGSAIAARRALAYAMVDKGHQEGLGFAGYPAERGLYLTVLAPFGVHRQSSEGLWSFNDPDQGEVGKSLRPAWDAALQLDDFNLSDLYDMWVRKPFGMKRGVMPIIALSMLLAHRASYAVYVDGLYEVNLDDVFVDRLLQSPSTVKFRRVSRSERDTTFIQRLATMLSGEDDTVGNTTIAVASTLFKRFKEVPIWAQKTRRIDDASRQVRDIVLKATDPEELLTVDLPELLKNQPDPALSVMTALFKTETAYPAMLHGLRMRLAELLGVDGETFEGLGTRATAAAGVTGDLRAEAFIMRAGAFEGEEGDMEGLASLLVHKPPRNWLDTEQDRAEFELAKLAKRFREAEAFAEVRGRSATATAISVVVGLDPKEQPLFRALEVNDREMKKAGEIADVLIEQLRKEGVPPTVEFAALARMLERLSGNLIGDEQ